MNQKPLRTRILSFALTATMVFTSFPITAFATEVDTSTQVPSKTILIEHTITAFDELGEGFSKPVIFDGYTYTRNVELNTAFEELKLPTELSVTVEKTTTTANDNAPVEAPPVETPSVVTPPAEKPAADASSAETPTVEKPTAVISATETPTVEKPKQESNTVTETIKETIPVTWKGDREYTPAENCMVAYTAVLPEGYALADSAKLPIINVMVGRQARAGTPRAGLSPGNTYYFDLSSLAYSFNYINQSLPDTGLEYVPFTYVGTINAYSYEYESSKITGNRTLFLLPCTISQDKNWDELNQGGLIFGENSVIANFTLRSLSAGTQSGSDGATPTNNEWDVIRKINPAYIGDYAIRTWGQDTYDYTDKRAVRGGSSASAWECVKMSGFDVTNIGFRPVIQANNPDSLTAVTLDLNGSSFDSNGSNASGGEVSSLSIVCSGDTFTAPKESWLWNNPTSGSYFAWNTQADGNGTIYDVGVSVPSSVTYLYAQWVPKQDIKVDNTNKTIYAGGQPLLVVSGATPGNSTIYIDTNKNGIADTNEKSLSAEGIIDAPSDNSDLSAYTIYGGKSDEAITGDTFITLAGGKLKAVYGGGKNATATVGGNKTVQVQGKPIVTTGIDLASLTGEKVLVCGALKGITGAIRLIKPTGANLGEIMAQATIDTNKSYVNAAKFSIENDELVLDKKASTVILSGALDAAYNGTNITTNTQHFGTGTARYGKEWIGVLLPVAGYKLPDNVNVTIGGTAVAKGSDYNYNNITGEIKIEVVKGNIVITANGVPITYTINYNANGGLVSGKPIDTLAVKYGDTITFPTAKRKAGSSWSFLGWAYKPDAVTADFAGGATTNNPLSNIDTAQITLYAVWQSSDSSLPTSLQNGSFEVPVNNIFSNMYDYTQSNNIKWLTTASDRKIELGNPSKGLTAAYDAYGTRTASEGLQFAELNATRVSALYQMVATEPGSTLYWGLDHRARSKTEKETMEVWIGSSTQVNEAINAYKADGNKVSAKTDAVFTKYPTLQRTANITHDWLAWYPVDGTYTVPAEQTATMFAFVSIAKPASNSCGNLLDNVFFSTVKPLARREITIRAGVGGTVRVSDAGGFTPVDSTTPYNKSLELGDMLQATVMANSGYSFNGGYVDGKYYTKEALLTGFSNLRLTMGDTAPNITPKEITILFAKDSIISLIPNGGIYPDGEKTLVADVNNPSNSYTLSTPSREGYAFNGWLVTGTNTTLNAADAIKYLTSEDDGTTTLACGAKVSVPTEQGMILIAQWTEAPPTLVTTTLTLNLDGGRYGEEIRYGSETIFEEWQTRYELDASYGGANALELKAPVRDGYAFIGWKDVSNIYSTDLMVGDTIEYAIESGTAKLTVGKNTKTDAPATLALTAQWEKLPDAPVITTQPTDKALTYGYTVGNILSVTATESVGDTLSYQWYSSTTNSNTGGTSINGANSNSYTVPENKVVGNYYYYCVITATRLSRTVTTTSNTATVAVGKATLTAKYAGESITFGDTPALAIAVTGFVNGESASNATSYSAPTIGTTIPTGMGSHTLTPSGGSATNYDFVYTAGTLAIAAGNMTSDVVANDYTGVYDGVAHGIAVTLSGKATGATIKYGTTATDCTNAELTYTDAGNYCVYYKVSKANYAEVTGSAMVNISKKPVSINTVTVNNKTYDGDTITTGGKITIKDVVAGETVTASGSITFADKNVGDNKEVNITGITLDGTDAKNYTIVADVSNVATTAKITPKSVTINWQNTDTKTYDGQPSKVTATVASGLVGGDKCNVTVTDGDKTNAGNHTATATADNLNYSINSNTKGYTISKATLTATYEDESIIYKNATPTLAVKVTGFVNGENAGTATAYTAPTVTFPTVSATDVGKHTLTPIGGSATNYDFTYVSGVLNILARNFDMVSIKNYLGDYDAQAHSATLVNSDPSSIGVTVKYYSNAACTEGETNVAPTRTDAGTTTVYYKVSATGFNSFIGSATITINKKKVTPSIDRVNDKTYDGNTTATAVIKLNGIVAADITDATASGDMQFTDKNAGANKSVTVNGITLGGTKGKNYELTATVLNATTTAKITQKEITLTWSGHTGLTYTGKAQNVTATIPVGDVVTGDTVNLTVTGGNKTAVGTNYTATATIDNSNYSLANATQSYTIAPATFAFTATPYEGLYDNMAHRGVTLTGTLETDNISYSTDNGKTWTNSDVQVGAVGDTTITIKVERQYHTTVTQTVTAKVRQAPIIKLLKPVFDSTDLKKATLGGTVTEGSFPIATQIFEYRKLGSNDWTSLNAGTTNNTITTYSQTVADLAENTEYELRLSATDSQNNKASETILFRTQSTTPPTGAIEGEVDGGIGGGIGNITVTLEMGNTVIATITGLKNSDTFRFENLPDGEYNLVATDGTYTVTKMATVKDGGTATLGIILIGKQQSVVKVEYGAPPVAADGLNEMFATTIYTNNTAATNAVNSGGTVEMRLTADEAKKKTEVDAINQKATVKKTVGMMVDLTMDMIIMPNGGLRSVENITDTKALMEIAVPLPAEAQGKQSYQMLRYHNGNVDELTLLSTNAVPTTEGFRIDGAYAYIYAEKFSTYAIAYDKPNGGGGGESGGGDSETSYYTITPTKSVGGQISPDKPVTVRGGNSVAFTMTPDEGYEIKEVKVDGKSVGVKAEYLFTDIWKDHTIAVSFKKATTSTSKPKPNPTPETKPETAPGEIDSDSKLDTAKNDLDKQKEDIKDDIISKRDDAIAALPDTLTDEQRQDAIDELNKVCDDAIKALDSAKSASEVSDILNNAIQALRDVVEKFGGAVTASKPADGKRPFILLSALLALMAILLAALTIFKKCTKKRKLVAIAGAILAVVIFLITTGWNGIAFANLWTIAVALATAIPAIIIIMKMKEEKEKAQEENIQ